MSRETFQAKSLWEMWELISRYRWRFLLPLFAVVVIVLAAGMMLPRKFQAEAIFERRTDMVLAEITTRGASQGFQNPRGTVAEEISGQPAIDDLIDSLKVKLAKDTKRQNLINDPSEIRARVNKQVLVRYDISSNELDRIRLTYTSTDAEFARLVVNTLIENHIARTQKAMEQRLQQSSKFFEDEVARERHDIEELEAKMLTFEISHADLLPDNPVNLQTLLTQAQTELSELEQKSQSLATREASLRQSLEATSATTPSIVTGRNPELVRLETRIRELQTELALYTGVYKMTEKHPDLQNLREQIADLQKQAAETEQDVVTSKHIVVNPKRAGIELQLTNIAADREAIAGQLKLKQERIEKLNAQTDGLFPVRSDYRKLSRDVEQKRRQLAFWEDNLRRVRMALSAENGDRGVQFEFLKPCDELDRPVSPNLSQLLVAALALGLVAGGAWVFISHRGDQSFTTGESLASAVNLPLFGSVSEIISARERRVQRLRRFVLYPANAAAMAGVILVMTGLLYLSLERPQTFDKIRRQPAKFVLDRITGNHAAPDGGAETK